MNAQIVPVLRPGFGGPVGQPVAVTLTPGYNGVVVVEALKMDANGTVVRIAVYVNLGAPNGSYTPKAAGGFWAVDLPQTNVVDVNGILSAIVNGDPARPPPPVTWG